MRKRTAAVLLALTVGVVMAVPAFAAVPKFTGNVGPGFTISMVKKPRKAGKITLVVNDRSSSHNFHLKGPNVNVKTTVAFTGTKTFKNLVLKKGKYTFVCDPHASSMRGSFTIK
jgi:plastocyanin